MMKKVHAMSTMLPMGLSDERSVCTTSLRPGARLMTRSGRSVRSKRKTRSMLKILGLLWAVRVTMASTDEMTTRKPSMRFQLLRK